MISQSQKMYENLSSPLLQVVAFVDFCLNLFLSSLWEPLFCSYTWFHPAHASVKLAAQTETSLCCYIVFSWPTYCNPADCYLTLTIFSSFSGTFCKCSCKTPPNKCHYWWRDSFPNSTPSTFQTTVMLICSNYLMPSVQHSHPTVAN